MLFVISITLTNVVDYISWSTAEVSKAPHIPPSLPSALQEVHLGWSTHCLQLPAGGAGLGMEQLILLFLLSKVPHLGGEQKSDPLWGWAEVE